MKATVTLQGTVLATSDDDPLFIAPTVVETIDTAFEADTDRAVVELLRFYDWLESAEPIFNLSDGDWLLVVIR